MKHIPLYKFHKHKYGAELLIDVLDLDYIKAGIRRNGIHIGSNVIINNNASMLDGGDITIGNHTLIGPNCSFYTSTHPMDYMARRKPQETCRPITIGDDCWLGGNVVVVGGVSIGSRSVIGAGSVVVKDIPEDCFAVGNPCKVIRKLK